MSGALYLRGVMTVNQQQRYDRDISVHSGNLPIQRFTSYLRGPDRGGGGVPMFPSCLNFTSSYVDISQGSHVACWNSSKRNCDICVAFPISLEWSVVRRQFVALVSPFQGHVACRNLPLTGPHLRSKSMILSCKF